MLTVDKERFSLQLQKREHFFTQILWKAFGIALFIHLLGFGLFQIKKIVTAESSWLFPPIQLEAPLIQEPAAAIVTAHDESHLPIYLQTPKLSEPAFPVLPPLNALVTDIKSLDLTADASFFPPIHSHPQLAVRPSLIKNSRPVASFLISGPLAERTVAPFPFFLNSSLDRDYHLQYIVIIDDQTGKVMWYEAKHTQTIPASILKEMEQYMRQLQFNEKTDSIITEGIVEFHLQRGIL